MNPANKRAIAMACLSLVLLSVGASRVPYGGSTGLPLSLIGGALNIVTALAFREHEGTKLRQGLRAGVAVVGVLILWAGAVAAATAVAGVFYARSHHTPYTGMAEVVMAGICSVVAPPLLTFNAGARMGWSRKSVALLWGYWFTFYPVTSIAAALGQPWGNAL